MRHFFEHSEGRHEGRRDREDGLDNGRGFGRGFGRRHGEQQRFGSEQEALMRARIAFIRRGMMEDEFGGGGGRPERGERGGRGGRGEHGGRGGGRRERLFESGDLKVLILHLLQQQEPRHGYEIIKAIGQLAGDDYSPSPGAIYPTLTFLEETGSIAIVDPQDARKRYVITDEGRKELAEQAATVERTLKRLQVHQMRSREQRPAELVRATENLRTSLRLKLGDAGANADRELLEKIATILDRAAVEIGRL